jgi:hypothetical protein
METFGKLEEIEIGHAYGDLLEAFKVGVVDGLLGGQPAAGVVLKHLGNQVW